MGIYGGEWAEGPFLAPQLSSSSLWLGREIHTAKVGGCEVCDFRLL